MKKVLTRGGIEFIAVFLGIALSLWVDDYREERELNDRLKDDLRKIYWEVQSNIQNIENIIRKKLINVDNTVYIILRTVSVNSGYNPDQLIKMWNLADAVLRNGDVFYICNRIIDAEFEELN